MGCATVSAHWRQIVWRQIVCPRVDLMSLIDTIKVYQDEVVITKGNQITVYPIYKKRPDNLAPARSQRALVPADIKNAELINDTWNGQPCRKLIQHSPVTGRTYHGAESGCTGPTTPHD